MNSSLTVVMGAPLQELRGSPGLDALAFRELGKPFHTVANFFARQAQLIKLLQIEPKFRAGAEPVAEPQRRIGRDRALTVDDPSDSVHRHEGADRIRNRCMGRSAQCLRRSHQMDVHNQQSSRQNGPRLPTARYPPRGPNQKVIITVQGTNASSLLESLRLAPGRGACCVYIRSRSELVSLTEHASVSRETVRRRLAENHLKPWRKDMWCIPQVDGEYVARMEDVLVLYAEVPDPKCPVVCFAVRSARSVWLSSTR